VKKKKEIRQRHKWTEEEILELKEVFRKFFLENKIPGMKDIEKLKIKSKNKGGKIWLLSTDKIKKKISWIRLHPKD
jgi:hypothetical protein